MWEHYGNRDGLRVVFVRRDGEPAAAGAFSTRRVAGATTLRALGGDISDVSDVLAVNSPEARQQLVAALLDLPGWDVLDLPEVRPGTTAHSLVGLWPGPVHRIPASVMLELPGQPIDVLAGTLNRSAAKSLRRRLRRNEALDLEVREVPSEEVADALRRLLHLHARQWAGRGMTPEHGRSRFLGHLISAVPRMVGEGQAVVLEYRLDGQLLISSLDLVGREMVGGYLDGVAPEARQRLDISAVTLREELRLTVELGRPVYSMLRGEESYKYRLEPLVVRNERLLLVRPGSVQGELVARAALQRAAAICLAKQRVPWLRGVRSRVLAIVHH
jgi:CelD/BcsL family acetyltransferase involved in cellulose biosynthesis